MERRQMIKGIALGAAVATLPRWGKPEGVFQDGMELHHAFCVVRPPVSGNPDWHILNDSGHMPLGTGWGTPYVSSGRLTLPYQQVTKVGLMQVTLDETWSRYYRGGASVGFDKALFKVWNNAGAEMNVNNLTGVGNFWVDFYFWMAVE